MKKINLSEWQQKLISAKTKFVVAITGRGSGKSHALILLMLLAIRKYPRFNALYIRKTDSDLDEIRTLLKEFKEDYFPEMKVTHKYAKFPNGSYLYLSQVSEEKHCGRFQGRNIQIICADEVSIMDYKLIMMLLGSLRTKKGRNVRVYLLSNTNGHSYKNLKREYVDHCTKETQIDENVYQFDDKTVMFGTLEDNPFLDQEQYELTLKELEKTNPTLYKKWRFNNLNILEGNFLPDLKPFQATMEVPIGVQVYAGVDSGISNSTSIVLAFPVENNRLHIFDCLDITGKSVHDISESIKEKLNSYGLFYTNIKFFGDKAMAQRSVQTARSVFDAYEDEGISIQPADNNRLRTCSALQQAFTMKTLTETKMLPLITIDPIKCKKLIDQLEALETDTNDAMYFKEVQHDQDLVDALKYLLVSQTIINNRPVVMRHKISSY